MTSRQDHTNSKTPYVSVLQSGLPVRIRQQTSEAKIPVGKIQNHVSRGGHGFGRILDHPDFLVYPMEVVLIN